MAKATKRDKEILSIIFKRKLSYFDTFDDDMELIDIVKEYKEEEFIALNIALKFTCDSCYIYYFLY